VQTARRQRRDKCQHTKLISGACTASFAAESFGQTSEGAADSPLKVQYSKLEAGKNREMKT